VTIPVLLLNHYHPGLFTIENIKAVTVQPANQNGPWNNKKNIQQAQVTGLMACVQDVKIKYHYERHHGQGTHGINDIHLNELNDDDDEIDNKHKFPSTVKEYNANYTTLSCPKCKLFFPENICPFYTTKSEKMRYRTCPKCEHKGRMRTKPKFKKFYRYRIPAKRI
jgi:hypothetical protein